MWPKKTVEGVEVAINTRIDGRVRLRIRRPEEEVRVNSWEAPLIHTFEVELSQPLGMVLREQAPPPLDAAAPEPSPAPLDDDAPPSPPAAVEVAEVAPGGSAAASGVVRPGDVVVATSGTIGDQMWEKSTLEGVLAAISTRLAISPTIALRLRRTQHLGVWASEMREVVDGKRSALSAEARASLRSQRRELSSLRSDAFYDAIRDLTRAAVVRTSDPALLRGVLRRMRSCAIPVDSRLATAGMRAAMRARATDVGIAYFDALDEGVADERAYTGLIKLHAAAGRSAEALAVERRMSAEQVAPSLYTFNTLMSVCARKGDRRGMLTYFGRIEQAGLRATVESWNVVLSYCARHSGAGRILQAEDVINRMRKSGIAPDVVSYSCLAQSCVAAGDAGKSSEIYSTMLSEGVAPDLIFFNTALGGYAQQLMWGRSVDMLDRMQASGVAPDRTSFALALKACVHAHRPSQAARVVERMQRDGLQPDVRIYSSLVAAYGKAGRLRGAMDVLRQMRSESIWPNGYVYAGLLEASVVARQPTTAREIFEQMKDDDVAPDTVTYTLLIRAMLTRPRPRGRPAPPTIDGEPPPPPPPPPRPDITGRDAMAARLAYDVLRKMRSEGGRCAPNAVTYNAFLHGCAQFSAIDLAMKALEEMLDSALTPTLRTFEALVELAEVHGYEQTNPSAAAAQQLDLLLRIWDMFEQRRLPLHADIYVPMLRAARTAGDTAAARDLMAARRSGSTFPLPRNKKNAVQDLEAETDVWLSESPAEDVRVPL